MSLCGDFDCLFTDLCGVIRLAGRFQLFDRQLDGDTCSALCIFGVDVDFSCKACNNHSAQIKSQSSSLNEAVQLHKTFEDRLAFLGRYAFSRIGDADAKPLSGCTAAQGDVALLCEFVGVFQ